MHAYTTGSVVCASFSVCLPLSISVRVSLSVRVCVCVYVCVHACIKYAFALYCPARCSLISTKEEADTWCGLLQNVHGSAK